MLQKEYLRTKFEIKQNYNQTEKKIIAEHLGLTQKQVSSYFNNRRNKLKNIEKSKNKKDLSSQKLTSNIKTEQKPTFSESKVFFQ